MEPIKYRGNFQYNEKNPKSYKLGKKTVIMERDIRETKLYKDFIKALDIHDMRADANPFVVKCCAIAEEYAEQSRITEQGELFKKVYIKNTNDVPPRFARYVTNIGFVSFGGVKPYNRTLSNRGAIIKWYLQPITEQSSVVVTDEQISGSKMGNAAIYEAFIKEHGSNPTTSLKYRWQGVIWLLDKLNIKDK